MRMSAKINFCVLFLFLFLHSQSQEIITSIENTGSCSEIISIPITVQNCNSVSAISLVVEFDDTILSYTGYQNKHPLLGGFFFVNEDNGIIIFSWASLNPVNIGSAALIEYNFESSGGVSLLSFDTITSGNCEFSDGDGMVLPSQFISGQAAVSQPAITVSAGNDITITCGEAVSLNASIYGGIPPYTFEWSTGQTAQSIMLVPYETTPVSLNVSDSIGCTAIDDVLINVLPAANQQVMSLRNGWNGLSGYINPTDPSVETIFFNNTGLIILVDPGGDIYYPEEAINTIVNWDNQYGYFTKTSEEIEVVFFGNLYPGKTVLLIEGWNLLPVLSVCEVDVAELFKGHQDIVVKEVAGYGIFWPEMGISTLELLFPGKAYFVFATEPIEITYPVCLN
jgi:hypothetical protein